MRLDQFLTLELHDLLDGEEAWLHIYPKPGWYELMIRVRRGPLNYDELLCLTVSRTDFRTRTELWNEILCQVRLVLIFQS